MGGEQGGHRMAQGARGRRLVYILECMFVLLGTRLSFADPIVGVGPPTIFSAATAVRGLGVQRRFQDKARRTSPAPRTMA